MSDRKPIFTPPPFAEDMADCWMEGCESAFAWRLSAAAPRQLFGLRAPPAESGVVVQVIWNVGNHAITMRAESASAQPANRFDFSSDIVLGPKKGMLICYDHESARWRQVMPMVAGTGGGAPADAEYVVLAEDPGIPAAGQLGAAVIMRGALAARPAAARAGRLYYVTDLGSERWTRDTGSTWEEIGVAWGWVTNRPATFPPTTHGASAHDATVEATANKDQPGGYAGLNGLGRVPGSRQTYGETSGTAAEGNDPRIPTQAESDALAGTSGAPSNANRYVTNDDTRLTNMRTPTPHASTHADGSTDPLKLDDLATPDDNTDLNATAGRHGLLPKLSGSTGEFLRGDGAWAAPPAGGALTLTVVEKDLGATPVDAGSFDITGLAGLTAGKPVLVQQAAGPYTGKGDLADEAEMDLVLATGYVVDATTIRVFWNSRGRVAGNVKFQYAVSA